MIELGKKMRKKWNFHELDTQRMVYKDLYFKNNNSILLLWKAMLFSQKTIINLFYYDQLLQYKFKTLRGFNLILEHLLSLSCNWSKFLLFCFAGAAVSLGPYFWGVFFVCLFLWEKN